MHTCSSTTGQVYNQDYSLIYYGLLATDYASYIMILYYILNMLRLILSTHVCVYNVCVGVLQVLSDAETTEEVGKETVRPNCDPKL